MESAIAMKPVFISVLTKSLSKPILNRIKLTWKNLCEKLNKEVDDDKNNDITDEKLKTFQLSISTVSTWDESEKENYTMEILTTINDNRRTQGLDIIDIEKLFQVTIKASIQSANIKTNIDNSYLSYPLKEFVFNIYKSVCRKMYRYPDLCLEDENLNAQSKRDNNDKIMNLIKDSINDTVDEIGINNKIDNFFNNDIINNHLHTKLGQAPNIESRLPEPVTNLHNNGSVIPLTGGQNNIFTNNKNEINNNYSNNQLNNQHNSIKQDIDNKIDNILKEKNINLSDSKNYKSESSIISKLNRKSNKSSTKSNNNSQEKKINMIIQKDLNTTENKDSYKAENNTELYREVFSNSSKKRSSNMNSEKYNRNTSEKKNIVSKQKFFNNYLHL
jgi:hypothetical protein